jgi:D-glycero-alpha-D-manno-heptose-7-phosphate kinase
VLSARRVSNAGQCVSNTIDGGVIVTRTPVRITFFGGGSDYPDYFTRRGGSTLGAAIDKYTYVVLRPLAAIDPYRFRLIYAHSELCNTVDEIKQPVIRECLRELAQGHLATEIHYFADLPGFSGLGTSSSFTVGLLNALHAREGRYPEATELAELAVHVERNRLRETVGVQDQYTCALGGVVNLMMDAGGVAPRPPSIAAERLAELSSSLMMFFTGTTRYAHKVLDE